MGNRLYGPRVQEVAVYNEANQLLENRRYANSYDRNGNLVAKYDLDEDDDTTFWAYEYDFENRLVRVVKQEEDETTIVSFKYDPFGHRIEKRVEESRKGWKAEEKTYSYVYDNEDIILEIRSTGEEKDREYERGWGKHDRHQKDRHARRQHAKISRFLHGPGIDEPLAIEQQGRLYYYHADGLGSVVTLTDQRGRVVQSYEYSSFGVLRRHGSRVKQPYAFTAREWDRETGLYFYRARYYDPQGGRFLTPDPIGLQGGINLYAYVQNDPVNFIDPLGLFSVGDATSVAITVATEAARQAGIIGTTTATAAGIITAPFGDMISPQSAGEPNWRPLEDIRHDQEIERLYKEWKELADRYEDLCHRTGGCDEMNCN